MPYFEVNLLQIKRREDSRSQIGPSSKSISPFTWQWKIDVVDLIVWFYRRIRRIPSIIQTTPKDSFDDHIAPTPSKSCFILLQTRNWDRWHISTKTNDTILSILSAYWYRSIQNKQFDTIHLALPYRLKMAMKGIVAKNRADFVHFHFLQNLRIQGENECHRRDNRRYHYDRSVLRLLP